MKNTMKKIIIPFILLAIIGICDFSIIAIETLVDIESGRLDL